MAAKDERGAAGEDRAVAYVRTLGYRVLARNWRCDEGELDVVAAHGRELVVVEVKTRRSLRYGDPLAAVDRRKLARLWRLGLRWRAEHAVSARLRIDVIGITGDDPSTGELVHLQDVR